MAEKFTKKEVNYGPAGRHHDKCKICEHYVPARSRTEMASCQIVSGAIRPDDWCEKFMEEERL